MNYFAKFAKPKENKIETENKPRKNYFAEYAAGDKERPQPKVINRPLTQTQTSEVQTKPDAFKIPMSNDMPIASALKQRYSPESIQIDSVKRDADILAQANAQTRSSSGRQGLSEEPSTGAKIGAAVTSGANAIKRGMNNFASIVFNEITRSADTSLTAPGQSLPKAEDKPTVIGKIIPDKTEQAVNDYFERVDESYSKRMNSLAQKYMTGSSAAEGYLYGAVSAFTAMIPTVATAFATGGASLASMIPFMAQAAGNYYGEAKARGMSDNNATKSGLAFGILEGLTEMIPFQYGFKLLKGGTKNIAKYGIKQAVKTYNTTALKGVVTNMLEEMTINPMLKGVESGITGEQFPLVGSGGIFDPKEAVESAIGGASLSLLYAALGLPMFAVNTANQQTKINSIKRAGENLTEYLRTSEGQKRYQNMLAQAGELKADSEGMIESADVITSPPIQTAETLQTQPEQVAEQDAVQAPPQVTQPAQVSEQSATQDAVQTPTLEPRLTQAEATDVKQEPVIVSQGEKKAAAIKKGDHVKIDGAGVGEVVRISANGISVKLNGKEYYRPFEDTDYEVVTTDEYIKDIDRQISELKTEAKEYRRQAAEFNKETSGAAVARKGKIGLSLDGRPLGVSENEASSKHKDLLAKAKELSLKAKLLSEEKANILKSVSQKAATNQRLAAQPAQVAKQAVKQTQQERSIAAVEAEIAKTEEVVRVGIPINLQAFAKKRLAKYYALLKELKSKNVSSEAIAEVEKLMDAKDTIVDRLRKEFVEERMNMKKDFQQMLQTARNKLALEFKKEKEAIKYMAEEKQAEAIAKLSEKYTKKIDNLNKAIDSEKYKSFWKDALHKQDIKEKTKEFREKLNKEITELKQHQKEMAEKRKSDKKLAEIKTKLLKSLSDLAKNKNKLRPHYRDAVNELVELIDVHAKSITERKRVSLENTLAWFKKNANLDSLYSVPDDLAEALARLNKAQIKYMTAEQVQLIQNAVDHIIHQNNLANKLISLQKVRDIKEASGELVEAIDAPEPEFVKKKGKISMFFRDGLLYNALRPKTRTLLLVGWDKANAGFRYLYESLNEGQSKKLAIMHESDNHFSFLHKKTIDGKKNPDYIEISDERKEVDLPSGKVKLTQAEIISLYMATRNADNWKHFTAGGARPESMYAKHVYKDADIPVIKELLSKSDKKIANRLIVFFDDVTRKHINKTSLALNGYEKAWVKNYYPIWTDRMFNNSNFKTLAQKAILEGAGYLKERQGGANPVIIEDFRKVVERTTEAVSSYSGLAIPLRDAKMLLGQEDVKLAMSKKYGQAELAYYRKLFEQMEHNSLSYDPLEGFIGKVVGNLQQAVLGFNLWISGKQIASVPTAFASLSPRDIRATMFKTPDWNLMTKYSDAIWYRRKGFVTRESGQISERAEKLGKAGNWTTKMILYADGRAISAIWQVAETETKRLHPNLKGDEFYKKVAKRTEEVIFDTQPNYTLMQRSDYGRNKSVFIRMLTLFSTQRNQNFNLMVEAIGQAKKDPSGSAKTIVSVMVATLVIALIDAARDSWRDREVTIKEDFVASLISNMYFAGDLYERLTTNYDFDNIALSELEGIINSAKALGNPNSTGTPVKHLYRIITSLAQFTGLPVRNVMYEVETLLKKYNPELYDAWRVVQAKQGKKLLFNEALKLAEADYKEKPTRKATDNYDTLKRYKKQIDAAKDDPKERDRLIDIALDSLD